MSNFIWLSEVQMRRIKPYFPLPHGVPRVDDRRVISGTIFVIGDPPIGLKRFENMEVDRINDHGWNELSKMVKTVAKSAILRRNANQLRKDRFWRAV